MQVILKLYEDASILKINFAKAKSHSLEHMKIDIIKQKKWNGHNFALKYLELRDHRLITFVTFYRFCQLSKTPSHLPILNEKYQLDWNSNHFQMKSACPL